MPYFLFFYKSFLPSVRQVPSETIFTVKWNFNWKYGVWLCEFAIELQYTFKGFNKNSLQYTVHSVNGSCCFQFFIRQGFVLRGHKQLFSNINFWKAFTIEIFCWYFVSWRDGRLINEMFAVKIEFWSILRNSMKPISCALFKMSQFSKFFENGA